MLRTYYPSVIILLDCFLSAAIQKGPRMRSGAPSYLCVSVSLRYLYSSPLLLREFCARSSDDMTHAPPGARVATLAHSRLASALTGGADGSVHRSGISCPHANSLLG